MKMQIVNSKDFPKMPNVIINEYYIPLGYEEIVHIYKKSKTTRKSGQRLADVSRDALLLVKEAGTNKDSSNKVSRKLEPNSEGKMCLEKYLENCLRQLLPRRASSAETKNVVQSFASEAKTHETTSSRPPGTPRTTPKVTWTSPPSPRPA